MTTIAYRSGVLAADTLTTWGDGRDGTVIKIAKRGAVLAAMTGSMAHGQAFMDWFTSGMRGDPPSAGDPDASFSHGFIITPDDWFLMWGPHGWERTRGEMLTAGTGGEYAAGAMEAGADPERAVEVAIKRDTKSGGEITVLRR